MWGGGISACEMGERESGLGGAGEPRVKQRAGGVQSRDKGRGGTTYIHAAVPSQHTVM